LRKNSIVILLGFLGFIVMADNWVVSPILPAISENIGVAVERARLLIAAYMIPFGIFQIIFGPLADRYGKKQVIAFSIILFTVATGMCAAGFGLTDLAIYRALIGDIFPIEQRQGAIGTFMGISFLGQGLSMVTGGAIAYFLNWRGVFAIYALLAVIPMGMLIKNYKLLPDTKHADSKFIAPYLKLLADPKSLFTYILVLLEGMFIIGSFSYLGAFIAKTHHFNYLTIGVIMTAFGFMTVVGGRLSGKLVLKIDARKILTLGLVFAGLADFLVFNFGRSLGWLVAGVGLLGIGFIFTHSTLLTRATEFACKARGAAMSLVAFCFMGGGGLGTAIGGKIASVYGLSSLFMVYAVALVITLILSFILINGQVVPSCLAAESEPA
jgi:predicted MFS family arabinose efflux permease